ncbi:1512_t:CDS:1 [Cetraspora pellucida]|uniref:1512_t:CDS:1 n=1 Tax=Cetraspora pellucida TaxID=1433469 RepID=A0ACA9M8X6_9GLOM|nr:1512_t:CDS:1 [Cetraspora pellucida]
MSKINAIQSEKNRFSMLLAEYINDIVLIQNDHAIKSRKDSLWSLVTELSSAFNSSCPTTHFLFKDAPEISEAGIENILSFYESGKLQFKQILAQDVYKTELCVTSGHHLRNIKSYTYTQLESIKKQKNNPTAIPTQLAIVQEKTSTSQQILSPELPKQICRATTTAERDILSQLFNPEEQLTEAKIASVLSELETISPE